MLTTVDMTNGLNSQKTIHTSKHIMGWSMPLVQSGVYNRIGFLSCTIKEQRTVYDNKLVLRHSIYKTRDSLQAIYLSEYFEQYFSEIQQNNLHIIPDLSYRKWALDACFIGFWCHWAYTEPLTNLVSDGTISTNFKSNQLKRKKIYIFCNHYHVYG